MWILKGCVGRLFQYIFKIPDLSVLWSITKQSNHDRFDYPSLLHQIAHKCSQTLTAEAWLDDYTKGITIY